MLIDGKRMVLVGAEGVAEISGASWHREATQDERTRFFDFIRSTYAKELDGRDPKTMLTDGTGRPYWLIVMHDDAPAIAIRKAEQFTRCLRIHVDY